MRDCFEKAGFDSIPAGARRLAAATLSVVLAGVSAVAGDDDWPQFRGPGARGVSPAAMLPERWDANHNVAWRREVPGRGWSSPIVTGGKVIVTTAVNQGETEPAKRGLYFGGNRPDPPDTTYQWKILCLDFESGDILWERLAHEGVPGTGVHIKNSYASETPVTDGECVYAYFGNVGVSCWDLAGEPRWAVRWPARKIRFGWGTAASPVLFNDRLYIVNDNEEDSFLVAIDKRTGDEVWRVSRDEKSNWSTPYVWENTQRTEIITPGSVKTRAYDLDGNLLYEFGGASSITIATPYAYQGLLYVSSGYILDLRKPVFAVRPGASGNITLGLLETSNEYVKWCHKSAAPYNPSTLVYRGLLYVLYDRGFLACYDAATGEPVYKKQRLPNGRAFTASPWACGGRIYCINEYGVTFVIKAGREFEIVQTNPLADDDMVLATPAIADNRLLIRTASQMVCVGEDGSAGREGN